MSVGLDLDLGKMPSSLKASPEGWLQFNKDIIDATRESCIAYKPNWAFYEALGQEGMQVLKETIDYIGSDHLIIADAKRGDIGNTSNKYSNAVFDVYGADAVTVAPYMGMDSVNPFRREGKWLIILALTSNPGSHDFQRMQMEDGRELYEVVLEKMAKEWSPEEGMFVVGATHPTMLKKIREIVPDHFLLVPGVGSQGGSVDAVCENGLNSDVGLIINSSRSIIYAGGQNDNYKTHIAEAAKTVQSQMAPYV